jgi:DNA-binding transcriptional LysR family regulator
MRNLERELGSPLFERTNQGARLTPAGEALAPGARDIVHRLDAVVDAARAAHGIVSGTMRVGIMHSLALIDGASLLRRFHEIHPHVVIQPLPTLNGAATVADGVRRGDLDIAFAWSTTVMSDDLLVQPLASDSFVLVTADEQGPDDGPATAETLTNMSFIDLPLGWATRTAIDQAFSRAGVTRTVIAEVADMTMCIELARAGLGATILPSSYISNDRGMRIRPFIDITDWTMSVILPGTRSPTAAARELANLALAARDA